MGITKKKIRIIIFGASGSIGSYLAKEYMSQNSELLLFVKNLKSKKKIINKLKFQSSAKIIIDQLNFTNFSSITKKINKHKSFVKNSDIIINATGNLGEIKNVLNINFKKFKNIMDINFFSNLILLQNLSKFIKNNKNLLIIFFSGGGVTSYRKNFGTYSISKLSLVKLIEIASNEINNKNVRINAIAPGIIQSKMVDITINNRKLVSKKEIKKIERDIKYSNHALKKLFKVINFLRSNKGKQITGKLISSKWDNIENWDKNKIEKLIKSDLYSMRRVQ
jgi:3-oxoacyl-[acyl-carrier protein] reductase